MSTASLKTWQASAVTATCAVLVRGKQVGAGVLIEADKVLTCAHVLPGRTSGYRELDGVESCGSA